MIEIGEPFKTDRAPEICKTHVCAERSQLDGSIKRKRSALGHEAGERVAVEMVAMSWIGRPIRIRVVRRYYFYQPRRLSYAMKLADKRHNVGNVLDYVAANDLIEFVIAERVRQHTQVVNHVGVRPRI